MRSDQSDGQSINHDALQEASESLLPAQPSSDSNTDLNVIADIIRRTKKSTSHDALATETRVVVVNEDVSEAEVLTPSVLDKIITGCKAILPYPMLACRFATCSYRALPNEDAIVLTFQMPGLNRWSNEPQLVIAAVSLASIFALTDAIQTMIATKDKVFDLCTHPNWLGRTKDFFQSIRAGNYPFLFLALFAFSALPGSWKKAEVGLKDMIQRADALTGAQLSTTAVYSIICPVSLFSCFCSSVFLFQKSAWVVRAFKELEGNPAWDRFRLENKAWMRKINMIGASQATVGAFATGIAMFYSHHKFQFEVSSLFFFLLVGVTSVSFNYLYCYNPVYLFESILEKQNIEAKKQQLLATAVDQSRQSSQRNCLSTLKNINAFFSVAGGAIMQSPAFIRSLQVLLIGLTLATGKDHFKSASESPYFLVPATVVSLFFVWGAFVQGRAMWASPSEKKSQENGNQPVSRSALTLA